MKKPEEFEVEISGMTCTGCSDRVKKVLEKYNGIESAEVSHETGQAHIKGSIPDADLKEIIEKAGYELTKIRD